MYALACISCICLRVLILIIVFFICESLWICEQISAPKRWCIEWWLLLMKTKKRRSASCTLPLPLPPPPPHHISAPNHTPNRRRLCTSPLFDPLLFALQLLTRRLCRHAVMLRCVICYALLKVSALIQSQTRTIPPLASTLWRIATPTNAPLLPPLLPHLQLPLPHSSALRPNLLRPFTSTPIRACARPLLPPPPPLLPPPPPLRLHRTTALWPAANSSGTNSCSSNTRKLLLPRRQHTHRLQATRRCAPKPRPERWRCHGNCWATNSPSLCRSDTTLRCMCLRTRASHP
jgi:hypothetical protein